MSTFLKLRQPILECLGNAEYVLLRPIPSYKANDEVEILFGIKELSPVIQHLKKVKDLSSITLSTSFQSSKAVLKFEDNVEMAINFVHRFTYNALIYLDEEDVRRKRVKDSNAFWIPCVEHIFEHFVLSSFLHLSGISKSVFQYFNEFHILVQEDLLDAFNLKYGTSFSNIYQLTDFDAQQREQIIRHLRQSPANKWMKTINVRWHNFLGAMRPARVV